MTVFSAIGISFVLLLAALGCCPSLFSLPFLLYARKQRQPHHADKNWNAEGAIRENFIYRVRGGEANLRREFDGFIQRAMHEAVHELGRELVAQRQAGNAEVAIRRLPELRALHNELIGQLHALSAALVRERA